MMTITTEYELVNTLPERNISLTLAPPSPLRFCIMVDALLDVVSEDTPCGVE